jgi:hypothetical protein
MGFKSGHNPILNGAKFDGELIEKRFGNPNGREMEPDYGLVGGNRPVETGRRSTRRLIPSQTPRNGRTVAIGEVPSPYRTNEQLSGVSTGREGTWGSRGHSPSVLPIHVEALWRAQVARSAR